HALFKIIHHIVTDRVSSDVFLREAVTLYEAFSKGQTSPLSELPLQYGDFAYWQRQHLQGKLLEDELSSSKRKLANPPVLALEYDRTRTPLPTHAGGREQWFHNDRLWEEFKVFMLAENATRFMGLPAVHAILLHRYTGQKDLLFGSPISNRDRAEIENLI